MSKLGKFLLLIAAGALGFLRRIVSPRPKKGEPAKQQRAGIGFKGWAIRLTGVAIVLGLLGFLGAASGVIPIKASSRHWAITAWLLDFSKRRSVSTHTIGSKSPPLDQPWLIHKGANHYEIGCAMCHGRPGLTHPPITHGMTPPPPHLPPRMSRWEAVELFYIVKHGIKFTGMPAWPSQQRDDEVWSMVVFLQALPNLDATRYEELINERLINNATAPLPKRIVDCVRCHGVEGLSNGHAAFPKLAGQRREYLLASLQAYARGQRHSGTMKSVAWGLSDQEMRELVDYYANLPGFGTSGVAAVIGRGEAIARQGIPSQEVPACDSCHGESATPRNPNYPNLAGQYADYLFLQLELFKKQQRGGTSYAHLMTRVAAGLTEDQMRDVAGYYAAK